MDIKELKKRAGINEANTPQDRDLEDAMIAQMKGVPGVNFFDRYKGGDILVVMEDNSKFHIKVSEVSEDIG